MKYLFDEILHGLNKDEAELFGLKDNNPHNMILRGKRAKCGMMRTARYVLCN